MAEQYTPPKCRNSLLRCGVDLLSRQADRKHCRNAEKFAVPSREGGASVSQFFAAFPPVRIIMLFHNESLTLRLGAVA